MSDAGEPVLAALEAHAARKAERDRPLVEVLTARPPDAGDSARERLAQVLTPAKLEELDRRVLALIETGDPPPEPPTFLEAAGAAQEAQRAALLNALLGRTARPAGMGTGLDGGARTTPPRPETHAATLARVLRTGEADVGANL